MRYDVLTTFPEMLEGPLSASMLGRARERGLIECHVHNLRSWTHDRHQVTDDSPFGGGSGMVMKPDPIVEAVEALRAEGPRGLVVHMSPQGERFRHGLAEELAREERLILLCGHYEGIDERVVDLVVDREVSVGDFVLTGGEIAALVVIDATSRFFEGVLGGVDSMEQDSFAWDGLLDCPHYTRPREVRGLAVPDVLLSGNHAEIARWRREQAIRRTWARRPDLLETARLTEKEREFVQSLCAEET
jgi:tRNA (guanine37-N1)-methyltransferase